MTDALPPEQWQRVKEVFERAVQARGAERDAIVSSVAADPLVREELAALLAAHDRADGFLDPPATQLPLAVGRRLGPYELLEHIGRGGMADVYRARDSRLGRDVAVKVLRGDLNVHARARFVREGRATAALSHVNVLAVHDVGEDAGLCYLVAELLEGETLRARIGRERPSIDEAIDWTTQIALGIAAAHDEGIVHRDLKPENVMIVDGGRVKILDFGVARAPIEKALGDGDTLSTPGMVIGTVGYLAPEQARGRSVRPSADLFSLGAILFELLTQQRAFAADTSVDTLRAVLDHEPPPPSSLRPDVPELLDRIVARCLAKDPAARFESARDLAFALECSSAKQTRQDPPVSRRRVPLAIGAGVICVALGLGIAWVARSAPVAPLEPPRAYPVTSSGHDHHPSVSPDGRFLAFTSDRDGSARIWLQQLDVGREHPLTEGVDSAPRFSPDGSQILFTRFEATRTTLYRIGFLGGQIHKVADDASDGDWSPDGSRVVFLRTRGEDARMQPILMIAQIDGGGERELARLTDRPLRGRGVEQRVRWSPDGTRIAISGFAPHPGTPQYVLIVPVDGAPPSRLPAPRRVGLVSAVAWDGPDALIYSQALSVSANSVGSSARIVRQRLDDQTVTTVEWTPQSSFVLDRWPGRGLVVDARSSRQNLREVTIDGGATRQLSNGTATDRQPFLAPDGDVIFTSNRGGSNLDIWISDRATGTSQRLTDNPADDWDPALTPDGKHLLWSSDRTGNFEIWMAERDGSNPRQITHDGVDAENPSATPDGRWIIYASGAPGRTGVWRARFDGSGATRIVPAVVLPEVSPDGRFVLFQTTRDARTSVVGVAVIEDARILPFEIRVPIRRQTVALLGRARWMPDGKAIAFLGQDDQGATGVFLQPFDPEREHLDPPRPLAGFSGDRIVESFDVDAGHVILAETDQRSEIIAITR